MGATPRIAPGECFNNLRIERELGRGAFAVVLLATDTLLGRQVALKVNHVPPALRTSAERAQVLHEVRLIARLKSPQIVTLFRVHELGAAGWAFEMEYVDGGNLRDRIADRGRLDPESATHVLRGVLSGLQAAHEQGVLHRDIKPGNVLLGTDGTVKLADFGLGRMLDAGSVELSSGGVMKGTPYYMAPEIFLGGTPDVASDIWSVGVLLHEMLAGAKPFAAAHLPDLMHAILYAEPPALGAAVPPALVELSLRCLAKEPAERAGSCRELLEILDGFQPSPLGRVREQAAAAPPAPRIFGRVRELHGLEELLDSASVGRGVVVLVSGETGVGKTALLEELGRRAGRRGFRWVRSAVTPVGGLMRPLLRAIRLELTDGAGALRLDSGRFGAVAARLRDLLSEAVSPGLPEPAQMVWALERLVAGLACERPLGLVVEDAHLCETEDCRILRELSGRLRNERVVLAIAYRSFDPDSSDSGARILHGLQEISTLPDVQHLALPPVGPDAIYLLLEDWAGGRHVTPEVAQRVIRKAEGNPLFALELVRHLESSRAITGTPERIEPGPDWSRADLPRRFHELVARRLAGLPEEDRTLLDAAAVDGVEFDGEPLAAVLERPLLPVLRDLQRIYREAGLIQPCPKGYRFAQPLTQEVIYAELAPELRREMHRRLAERLEERADEVDPERLGVHWERAGDRQRAAPHLLRAARAAALRQELRRTVDLCERGGLEPGRIDPALALAEAEILFHLAACLKDIGRSEAVESVYASVLDAAAEAGATGLMLRAKVRRARHRFLAQGLTRMEEQELRRAAAELPDGLERGMAHWILGVLDKNRGRLEQAQSRLREADAIFVRLGIDSYHSSALDELGSVARHAGRMHEAEALYEDAARVSAHAGRSTNAAISAVNQALARFGRGALDGLEERMERSIRELTIEGAVPTAAHARVLLGEIRYALGNFDGALRAARDALNILRDVDYPPGIRSARTLEGQLLTASGRLEEAAASIAEARAIADRHDNLGGRVLAAAVEAQRLCVAGDEDRAQEEAATALRLALDGHDAQVKTEAACWLAESALFGLRLDGLGPVEELLAPAPAGGEGANAAARSLLAGVRALASAAHGRILLESSAGILAAEFGTRRALLEIAARFLSAHAHLRLGERARAAALAGRAREEAAALRHAWLELLALRLLIEDLGRGELVDRRRELVESMTGGLLDGGLREALVARWSR